MKIDWTMGPPYPLGIQDSALGIVSGHLVSAGGFSRHPKEIVQQYPNRPAGRWWPRRATRCTAWVARAENSGTRTRCRSDACPFRPGTPQHATDRLRHHPSPPSTPLPRWSVTI